MQKEFGKIAHDFVNYEQSIKLVFNPKFQFQNFIASSGTRLRQFYLIQEYVNVLLG